MFPLREFGQKLFPYYFKTPALTVGKLREQFMDVERIIQLLARQLGQTASEAEDSELEDLLDRHPELRFFKTIIQSIESGRLHQEPVLKEDELVQESWSLLMNEIKNTPDTLSPQKRIIYHRWIKRVAIFIGVVMTAGGGFIYRQHDHEHQRSMATHGTMIKQISLPYGAPKEIVLPDSSIVWLNAGSHIHYTDNFIQKNREVYVTGEAYFDVKHDAVHPFLVHAGNVIIKVLGTAFNVEAYPDEDKIETTLIQGKVQVQIAGNPDKKIVLTPREKLTVINDSIHLSGDPLKRLKERSFKVQEIIPPETPAPIPEIAWVQDKLAFQDERFDELTKQLERRYDVHIYFEDTRLKQERLSGVFANENIEKAIKILQMTTPFKYRIRNDTVYLSK